MLLKVKVLKAFWLRMNGLMQESSVYLSVACNFMTSSKVLISLLLSTVTISCNDYGITGTWKRIDISKYYPRSDRFGNLVISPDSTFLIKGIDTHDSLNVPGWHSGGSMKGTWTRPDNSHIILLPTDVDKICICIYFQNN